jgi:hypothetical protein
MLLHSRDLSLDVSELEEHQDLKLRGILVKELLGALMLYLADTLMGELVHSLALTLNESLGHAWLGRSSQEQHGMIERFRRDTMGPVIQHRRHWTNERGGTLLALFAGTFADDRYLPHLRQPSQVRTAIVLVAMRGRNIDQVVEEALDQLGTRRILVVPCCVVGFAKNQARTLAVHGVSVPVRLDSPDSVLDNKQGWPGQEKQG